LRDYFSSFTALFHLFVKEGFIAPEQLNRFYYTYVLTLKEKIEKDGMSAVSFNDIIQIIWALQITEEEGLINPIIPRLYERLHEFHRLDKPLTSEEIL